jgi:hypothetical protein
MFEDVFPIFREPKLVTDMVQAMADFTTSKFGQVDVVVGLVSRCRQASFAVEHLVVRFNYPTCVVTAVGLPRVLVWPHLGWHAGLCVCAGSQGRQAPGTRQNCVLQQGVWRGTCGFLHTQRRRLGGFCLNAWLHVPSRTCLKCKRTLFNLEHVFWWLMIFWRLVRWAVGSGVGVGIVFSGSIHSI